MDPKVVNVYQGVGELLKRYKSGKLPKAFKIIPAFSNWEEILFLTNPAAWTPHAMFKATRIFASNLNAKVAQRYTPHPARAPGWIDAHNSTIGSDQPHVQNLVQQAV